ncbi:UPF0029-domain-containing protein [Suhomyces tanzawaensis NRRL Y-17324]|uniref:UPF0029-domain-containing protein n=1 Tax=Suhomyces tanzawaensis NRRL Y-17324 TaxID=984487 RepID=A0A1E4SF82_9ASCO|nr:UPF0029-domain-containing protein [Suhomyces tanzawaensis NRRL Y-17324]ODV78181.1 UPF0029-domain-containing protein [Suhomyces tanzawaensis NRRL Y-17324]
MTVEELHDEISAIEAIYPGQVEGVAPQVYSFTIPPYEALKIQMNFPSTYPEVKPEVLQILSKDPRTFPDERYIEQQVQEVIERIFQPGLVCIFEMISELEEFLERYVREHAVIEEKQTTPTSPQQPVLEPQAVAKEIPKVQTNSVQKVVDPLAGWIQSEPLVDRGSSFIAFVREVHSVEEATQYVDLLTTDRKIVRATHNITSWRIKGQNGVQYQDCDDDGETAAGGRLLHLLTMMDVWNVVVVVSRWFGGTHLGPDRFKHINSVAREAVLKAGIANGEVSGSDRKKKK